MNNLILIRHAKSSWSDPSLADYERPLNKRGKRDAPFMGKILCDKNLEIDQIISSPSVRTTQTIKTMTRQMGFDQKEIVWDESIYEASSFSLLKIIKKTGKEIKSLVIVGHNPGLTLLQNYLCKKEIDNIPTCAIVSMITAKSWSDIDENSFSLEYFEFPKKYFK